jgi:repressor LexA
MTLTKRQKEVLNYLVGFLNKNGYSPSFEEIAHALKLTSLATVHKHLSTLEKKGYIRRGLRWFSCPSRFASRCSTGM